MKKLGYVFVCLAVALAGCGLGPAGRPTTTPTGTATETSTITQLPSAITSITPSPTPTPLYPVAGYGPSNFPANVDPLTGLTVSDPALLQRRPMLIKV